MYYLLEKENLAEAKDVVEKKTCEQLDFIHIGIMRSMLKLRILLDVFSCEYHFSWKVEYLYTYIIKYMILLPAIWIEFNSLYKVTQNNGNFWNTY